MNIAEILRGLADKLEQINGQGSEVPHQDQSAQLHQVDVGNDENPDINTDSMVSPLQQKLELIKKVAGVDGAFTTGEMDTHADHDGGCPECGCDPCECDGHEADPLEAMKRMAGLPSAATVVIADEDEPFEG
jgi:hypothetical protein